MRPLGAKRATIALDVELRVEPREAPVLIQAFVAQLAVTALHMRVRHGLPRLDELQRDATVGGPRNKDSTAKLAAVTVVTTARRVPPSSRRSFPSVPLSL